MRLGFAALFVGLILGGDPLEDLAEAGRWDDLIVAAGVRLEDAPTDHHARYWLGRAWLARSEGLLGAGDSAFARDLADASLTRAIDTLALVPADDTAGPAAREWRAYARLLRGDANLADEMEAVYEQTGDGYAAYIRAMVAQVAGAADSVEWLRRATRAQPSRPEFQLALCDALASRGDESSALAAWESALESGGDRDALLRSLLGVLPDAAMAPRRLALLDGMIASDPGARRDGWLAWYRAHALEESGRVAEAEAVLAAADLRREAGVDRFHAHLLARLDRHAEALARLEPWVARFDPEATMEAIDLADALALGQHWDAAVQAYDLVLAWQRHDERAERNRALTLAHAGRSGEARSAWEELAARFGSRADVLNDAALMLEGMGDRERAGEMFELASGLDPTGPATENLAAFLLEVDPARSLALLEHVVAIEPTRDRALYLRKQARGIRFR